MLPLSRLARRGPTRAGLPTRRAVSSSSSRAAVAAAPVEKEEGDISSVFSSLGGDAFVPLEQRFSDLKKSLWHDGLYESWRSVLAALEERTEEIQAQGSSAIPEVAYTDIARGKLSPALVEEVKRVGTVVVHGAVPEQEALKWKSDLREYIAKNRQHARGFPADDPVVWENYHSPSQTKARSHPNIMGTQRFLLSLFHTSDPTSPVSVTSPISYYDRLRIRPPGDSVFALGAHIDGGSLERWEDAAFRSCWSGILKGGPLPHVNHDSWDLTPRLTANKDLYSGAGQCSVFRMFQGWTALSDTSPGEGTLQVFPDLDLATAYIILRPFFRPRTGRENKLGFDDWELDLDSTAFPGSVKGKGQELSDQTHPHLRLSQTMTSVPRVKPGTQVYWHCDVVHSVESVHNGTSDSSVFYIPAAPLTAYNARYLAEQRRRFEAGKPPQDFPGGAGETQFVERGSEKDILSEAGRKAIGYSPFVAGEDETEGGREVIEEANRILFG
ncbi:hypothetical protein JCM10213_002673 [Rhodosporidiobolus nylandii]